MPPAIFALSLAAFCIGTTEFIISGILLGVSADLNVSVPLAGLLVTAYAVGVAVGGPVLGLALARFPLKPTILGVMILFAAGQVLCALAPTYQWLLLARLVSACGHGVFFGVGTVAISQLVPEQRRGSAFSLFVGGITIANILGLPGGTAIGNAFGWRMAFFAIAGLAIVATLAVLVALPRKSKGEVEADGPLASQARQLLHQEVYFSYLAIGIAMVGQVAFGTFQVAILTEVTKIDPIVAVPIFHLIGGAGAIVGIWAGGRGADWNAGLTIGFALAAQIVCSAILLLVQHNPGAMAVMLFVNTAVGFAPASPLQVRILNGSRAAPRLAATLVSTAYNVGIAAGAAAGAALLSYGAGFSSLPAAGIVSSAMALGVIALSLHLSRRGIA